MISGITAASISTANAYIADVTPPEKRAAGFGMLGAAFGVGFVLGPALGGLLGGIDPRLPFWVAGGLSLANALYGLFVLPESLPPERRAPFALATRQPGRRAAAAALAPGAARAGGVDFPRAARAHGAAEHLRALRRAIATAGRARWSASRWPWSASAR